MQRAGQKARSRHTDCARPTIITAVENQAMRRNGAGTYVGFSSTSVSPAWWQRFPRPIEIAALRLWAKLPSFVRSPLVPLGGLFAKHTVSAEAPPAPESVPGVAEIAQDGFEPLENHTGAMWVARLWPKAHRRAVAETRPEWLEDPDSDGQLWLVRSPWESLTLDDTFALLWTWVERDRTLDERVRQARVSEVFSWTEQRALDWLQESKDR